MQQAGVEQDHLLEAHSQLHAMLPHLDRFKHAFSRLLLAERALARHLRGCSHPETEDLTAFHTRILDAQLEVQQQVASIAADTAKLRSTMPVRACAARTKSCPANAQLIS